MSALALVAELIPLVLGLFQESESNKYGNMPRPDYEIPESQKKALNIATNLATMRKSPSASVVSDLQEQTLAQAYKNMLQSGVSSSASMGAISNLQSNKNIAQQRAELANDQWWLQNQQGLIGQLGQMATAEQAQWNWDKAQPYMASMQTSRELENAGLQNIMNSLGQVTTTIDSNQNYKNLEKLWKELMGEEQPESGGNLLSSLFNKGSKKTPGYRSIDTTDLIDYLNTYKIA